MSRKKILIIEDEHMNIELFRSILQMRDYSVIEATNAEQGIELARNHAPSLILMDIQLPGIDGLRATKIIKEDPVLKEITVVALTAHAMQGDEEKARAFGCDGYITKPINVINFLDMIDQLIK
jgi:CheY-like chemotaxis protein